MSALAFDSARPARTAVLISGRGSNMERLIAACAAPDAPARVTLVLSDKPEARGLATAAAAGIATAVAPERARIEREATIDAALAAAEIDLVCLAGFMRILSAEFTERWRDRILNIHPSLLPSFRGLDTHQRALDAGVRLHGATVHLVTPELDDGPILAQAALRVRSDDTAETLASRVLALEHRLYPAALFGYAGGKIRFEKERIITATAFADWAAEGSPELFSFG